MTGTDTDTDTGTSSATATSTATGGGSTGGDTDTEGALCDAPATASCTPPSYPLAPSSGAPVVDLNVEVPLGDYCCDGPLDYDVERQLGGITFPADTDAAHIYRPNVSARPLPMIIFSDAQGGDSAYNETLFELLAQNGYLVVALETEGSSSTDKRDALTCAIRWVQTSPDVSDYASCDVVLMGQSSGGYGAWEAGRLRRDDELAPFWGDADLRALVLISAGTGSPMISYAPGDEVPLQVINGATDEEEFHGPHWYDRMFSESAGPSDAGRSLVWAYRFSHFLWGGMTGTDDRGEEVAAYYVNAFLDREVAGGSDLADWQALNGEAFSDDVLAPGGDTSFWSALPGFTVYSGGTDCRTLGETTCGTTAGCFWAASLNECANHPMVFTAATPSRARGDTRRVVEDFEDAGTVQLTTDLNGSQISVDAVVDLLDPFVDVIDDGNNNNYHGTGALLVQFAGSLATGSVTIPIDPPVAAEDFTHLVLRAGNVVDMTSTTYEECTALEDAHVDLQVELVPSGGASRMLDVPPLVQQDYESTVIPQFPGTARCNHQVMMQTLRFPLADFCEQGQFGGDIEAVVIHFPEQPQATFESNVLVDSIEFTSTPEDIAGGGVCTFVTSSWDCEADDEVLEPVETACTDEPGPACTTTQTGVAIPSVPAIGGGTFDGWVVHVPWLEDPDNPTTEDLDMIVQLCVAACEQEWSDDPDVTANCDGEAVFSTPQLREIDTIGPVRQIPIAQRDGSGIFAAQSLSCSLTDDCALAFDEHLAMAAPLRPTPAEFPLGIGQEYVVDIDTSQSELVVDFNGGQDSVALHGHLGYSFCPGGSANDPCPFYLGSLEVKSTGSIAIPVTCPWGTNNVTLYNVDIGLGQPAFGIAQGGTDMVGFPTGSLVFAATFKQNAVTYEVRGVNTIDVVFEAGPGAVEGLQIPIHGEVAVCGGMSSVAATGTFDVILDLSGGSDDSPPEIAIDIPTTVTCNTSVDLDAIASDPDGDLASVRWYIDDHLVEASVDALTFTTGHEVRAVARDDRGAATTATKSIGCVP